MKEDISFSFPPLHMCACVGAGWARQYSQIEKVDELELSKPSLSTIDHTVYCYKSYMHSLINFKERLLFVVLRTRDCEGVEENLN